MPDKTPQKMVPLDWSALERLEPRPATSLTIQDTGQEFVVSVGFVMPPIALGTTDHEIVAALADVQKVDVLPVARFCISPQRLREFAEVFQQVAANVSATQGHADDD